MCNKMGKEDETTSECLLCDHVFPQVLSLLFVLHVGNILWIGGNVFTSSQSLYGHLHSTSTLWNDLGVQLPLVILLLHREIKKQFSVKAFRLYVLKNMKKTCQIGSYKDTQACLLELGHCRALRSGIKFWVDWCFWPQNSRYFIKVIHQSHLVVLLKANLNDLTVPML
jgi:hypothetical protein